ncbi:uncharacterized protein [Lolium perenne]|uniref:uncharacterized protein n=1 Tax=Lolium perenne TaxID=4522 RepID=UPI0021EAABFE|nr:uncharacterized protein LOC127342796 [Lolium perenne]
MFTSAAKLPPWLLTGSEGYIGDDVNERTAIGFTKKQLSIKATFFLNSPPQPSKLCVHCPDAKDIKNPRVLCVVGDHILFRVAITTRSIRIRSTSALLWSEYFLYRAERNRPMLKLLPDPPTDTFNDSEVGILPHGDGVFTIAALLRRRLCLDRFELLLFHSKAGNWTSMFLSVVGPPKKFPIEVEHRIDDLSCHFTTNVIVIGGEYGTIAWVDLWGGIVLCDILTLSEKPMLRTIPVPLPMGHITGNNGKGFHFGRGMDCRGIAFINGSFKFVELELDTTEFIHIRDKETGLPTLIVHGWTITTYSNSKMSCSYEDWQKDGMVRSSEVTINNSMVTHSYGLLPSSQEHSESEETREALQKLVLSDPSPSLGGEGVVYLVARVKLWHPKSWLISIDMRNKTLQSVVPLATPEEPYEDLMYYTSTQ